MITDIRRRFQDKAFKGVIWFSIVALIIYFSLETVLRVIGRDGSAQSLGTVNGLTISLNEFRRKVGQAEQRILYLREQFGPYADQLLKAYGLSTDPQESAMHDIIREKVLDSAGDALHLAVAPAFVIEKLQDPSFVMQELGPVSSLIDKSGSINMQALNAYLRRQGMTMQDFENAIEEGLRRSFLLDIARGAAYVPDYMLKQRYVREFVPKKYSILTFSAADYVPKETVSNEALKAFFDAQNRKTRRYVIPEKRSAQLWMFNPSDYGIKITDKETSQYYTNHKIDYVAQQEGVEVRRILFKLDEGADAAKVRALAEKVHQQILEKPKEFAALAKKHSQDAATAKKGGLMGFISKNEGYDPALERAAFALKKDNDVSPLVQTAQGIEIIQRVSKRQATYKPLEETKESINQKLLMDKFKRLFGQEARKTTQELAQNPQALPTFVKEKQAIEKTVDAVQKETGPLSNVLFKIDKGSYGTYFEGEQGIIAQLMEIQPAVTPSLESVKEQVVHDYQQQQAFEKMQQAVDQAYKRAATEPAESMNDLKNAYRAQLETTDFIAPSDYTAMQELTKKGISNEQLRELGTVGSIGKEITPEHGYIIRLDELKKYTPEDFTAHKKELLSRAYQELQQRVESGFVASLYKNATIRLNKSFK